MHRVPPIPKGLKQTAEETAGLSSSSVTCRMVNAAAISACD